MNEGTMAAPVMMPERFSGLMLIRQYQPDDAEELFRLVSSNRAHLGKRLAWARHYRSVSSSQAFIAQATEKAVTNGAPTCGVWFEGQLVGTVSFHPIDHSNESAVLGYWIDESMQGRGIISAAADALIEYGFEILRLRRIELVCAPDNLSSRAIAGKLGFAREADTRTAVWSDDPTTQMVVYYKERP